MNTSSNDSSGVFDDECQLVCKSNITNFNNLGSSGSNDVVLLKFLTSPLSHWSQAFADMFTNHKNGAVEIEFVRVEQDQLDQDIINEATSKIGLYDGFLTSPTVSGSIVEYNGWADLTPYVQESADNAADWADIFIGYRQYIAQYDGKIIMYPFDGDLLNLYYRPDILEHFGLQVPRTWDEYLAVANATHGKKYENVTLVGNCVARGCSTMYWTNLVLSSMTQYEGQWSGFLFDSSNMKPLTGIALEKTLEFMEWQVDFGPPDQFDRCISMNVDYMNGGTCTMTYNWGNNFKRYLEQGTQLRGRYGVQPTPGSQYVLDRDTMEFVDCDKDLCKHGIHYDDIGWVNKAPYLAFGGWACAVNNYTTDPAKKRLATEFCAFVSSKNVSAIFIVPNATATDNSTQNGQDPFRQSQMDIGVYVEHGYEYKTTKMFLDAIEYGLGSANVVTDIRFPMASAIYSILDVEFTRHLNSTFHHNIPMSQRAVRRKEVAQSITNQFLEIINEYDKQGTSKVPLLETYQRILGVYTKDYQFNQINSIRLFGYALAGIVMTSAVIFAIWSILFRHTHVVKASQPFFLVLICVGVFIFGSSIIPLGIDDSMVDAEAVGRACMAIPWLLSFGWTIVFSALYSKLRRVNLVYRNSVKFRRLKVSEKDVLLPFAFLFSTNLIFLLIWTTIDPLRWERRSKSELESYGSCAAGDGSVVWKVCFSAIIVVNGLALILANIEAYRARRINTEYGESKYIAVAMGSMLQLILVGVPSMFLVSNNPSASYFIRSSMVFVICSSVLYLIFIPKLNSFFRMKGDDPQSRLDRQSGLSYWVWNSRGSEDGRRLVEMQIKLKQLERLLRSEGVDVDSAFANVGFSTISEQPGDFSNSSMLSNRERWSKSSNSVRFSDLMMANSNTVRSANNSHNEEAIVERGSHNTPISLDCVMINEGNEEEEIETRQEQSFKAEEKVYIDGNLPATDQVPSQDKEQAVKEYYTI